MDAFYASVEVKDNPSLKGKPVIVGGNRKRGVVSSASYEARKFGVHSAQPIATAARLCPHGVFLPTRMSRYKEVSDLVFEIFHRFTPLVEPLSIDEAFLDVTGSTRLFGSPENIAIDIKRMIVEEIGITASAGVGPSKFIAKIASDLNKPDGLTVVPYDQVREFLDPLPIGKLWGVGKATQKALSFLGVKTVEELSSLPADVLEKKFGKHGIHIHLLAKGIDNRDVVPEREVKSIGNEETYAEDILDMEVIKKEILALAVKVARRLRNEHVKGKTITLKVKYKDFVQITRSVTLPETIDDGGVIYQNCCDLLKKTEAGKKPIRLLGVTVSLPKSHQGQKQLLLFSEEPVSLKKKSLNTAIDRIYEKFGEDKIIPGTLLKK
jgi:DNA polymerase-4